MGHKHLVQLALKEGNGYLPNTKKVTVELKRLGPAKRGKLVMLLNWLRGIGRK